MEIDLRVVMGIVFGLFALVGGVIVRDRQIMTLIQSIRDHAENRITSASATFSDGVAALENKFDDRFVRREELESRLDKIETSLRDLGSEYRQERRELRTQMERIVVRLESCVVRLDEQKKA